MPVRRLPTPSGHSQQPGYGTFSSCNGPPVRVCFGLLSLCVEGSEGVFIDHLDDFASEGVGKGWY